MATAKTKEKENINIPEPLGDGIGEFEKFRETLDHEAALVRDLLAQRYREFGLEKFEDRANEIVDSVRRIFARLAAPLVEGAAEDKPDPVIDVEEGEK